MEEKNRIRANLLERNTVKDIMFPNNRSPFFLSSTIYLELRKTRISSMENAANVRRNQEELDSREASIAETQIRRDG